MRILECGIIYSGIQEPALSSCCFPALCQLKDGRILASFRGGPQKGPYNLGEKGMTCISEDGGVSWSCLLYTSKHYFAYETPFGAVTMGVDTHSIKNGLGEAGGDLELSLIHI